MIYTGAVKDSTRQLYYLTRFGYQAGGSAQLQISSSVAGSPIGVFGCTPTETSRMERATVGDICTMMNASVLPCSVSLYGESDGLDVRLYGSYSIKAKSRIYFYLISCVDMPQRLEFRLDLQNLHGNHLSTEHLALPRESVIMLCIYGCLLVLAGLNWVWHREQNWKSVIFLVLFPCFKSAASLVAYLYWQELRAKGYSTKGFTACYYLAYSSADICFFLLLTLCASGYGWRAKDWHPERWQIWVTITFAIPLYAVGSLVPSVFFIFAFLVWIAALVLASRGAIHNSQIAFALSSQVDHDPMVQKIYHTLRWYAFALCIWIAIMVIAVIVNVAVLLYYQWIGQTVLDTLQLALFLIIFFLFRLRSNDAHYFLKPHLMLIASGTHFSRRQEAAISNAYAPYPGEEMEDISLPPAPHQAPIPPLVPNLNQNPNQNQNPVLPNNAASSKIRTDPPPLVISATFSPPEDQDEESDDYYQ
jgi:hypothetical protein